METIAGAGPGLRPDAGADLGRVLRARGLRLTPQRRQVVHALTELGHATPEELAGALRGVDPSTVYRSLALLEDLGLVVRTQLDRGAPTFSVAGHGDHLHLVCDACGGVQEVPAAAVRGLAAQVLASTGFALDDHHLALHGTCAGCRAGGTGDPT